MVPVAWDRLADATQPHAGAKLPLSIVTLGEVQPDDLHGLTPYFERLEQLVLDVAPRDPFSKHRAELNRAIDAATADWILVVREREIVDEPLAKEIADAATAAKARGFRIRSVAFYGGKPLLLEGDGGEVRLFHRRYYMRYANKGEWSELTVQGTVVRLNEVLRSVTFESEQAHHDYLTERSVRQSRVRPVFQFLGYLISTGTTDRNTLRYLWIEAGFKSAPEI
jgi:hypothetical protein